MEQRRHYLCEIDGTNANASSEVAITGSLNIQATPVLPFIIKLVSLTGGDAPGLVPAFNKFASYSWTIAASSGGVQNFAPNNFVLDTLLRSAMISAAVSSV